MTLRATVVPVTPFQQNCSIIWSAETLEGAVIDPGGDLEHILATVADSGVRLTKILLTHAHIDHAGSAGLLMLIVPTYSAVASRVSRVVLINGVTLFFIACLITFFVLSRMNVAVDGAVASGAGRAA